MPSEYEMTHTASDWLTDDFNQRPVSFHETRDEVEPLGDFARTPASLPVCRVVLWKASLSVGKRIKTIRGDPFVQTKGASQFAAVTAVTHRLPTD
jgi:hypothetical protein